MSAAAAVAADPFDSPRIQKAKKLLAENRGLSFAEQSAARVDLEAAGRGSAENAILLAIYDSIDRAAAEKTAAAMYDGQARAGEAAAKHLRERPKRWAALTAGQRAAYLTADKWGQAARPFLDFVAFLERDTTEVTPPENFEPPKW